MTKSHKRTAIPADVRQRLWINAAGRCEFKGCGKPVGTDFLTGRKINVGELAHIVSDSPDSPRGDAGRSKELAKDEANLMLACFDCHKRIDTLQTIEDYPKLCSSNGSLSTNHGSAQFTVQKLVPLVCLW